MPVNLRTVSSREDFQRFVELPFRLHRDEPLWIPPPANLYAHQLSRDRNPYFEHAEAEYLLAERDGELVGHVIAHIDHILNERKDNSWGLFGFFESENDPEVARALLGAAADWLADRGRDVMVGPLQFTAREDPGVLVEGNDRPPVILQPWNPTYYGALLEGAGLRKSVDVLWREVELDAVPGPLMAVAAKWAQTARDRFGVTIRPPSPEEPEVDMERVFRWSPPFFESHWGYVAPTEGEIAAALEVATPFLGPGTLLAEREGELVGASMMMPDYNQALANRDGEVIRTSRQVDQARMMMMVIDPAFRHLGIAIALSHEHIERARGQGIGRFVIGWSLEDNEQMNSLVARLGLPVARRHRVYEKELSSASPSGVDPATSE